MTTSNYASCAEAHMGADVDVVNDAISALLIDTALYTVDLDAHTSLEDIPTDAIIAESLITGKSLVGSEFHADPTVFQNVSADEGVEIGAIIVCKTEATLVASTLLYYDDEAPELPATPDGEDVTITWGAAEDPENPTNIIYALDVA